MVLIISPYFPPTNAADMQRIRMSLYYLKDFGWDAEVVTVNAEYSDMIKDPLLKESLPAGLQVHSVSAFPRIFTSKFGLGSIAIRSLPFYRQKVNQLLTNKKYDLIYFSTTQFPVCILGRYWKKKYGVPYVIDMQDRWHSEYYQNKPKKERPPKHWFSYHLHKYLEPLAMKRCDGLISVSQTYINDLKSRYPVLKNKPASVITFGAFDYDLEIVKKNYKTIPIVFKRLPSLLNLVYIGRGGADMRKALNVIFSCFHRGLKELPVLFSLFKFHFIGTSYAPPGQAEKTILPLAESNGVSDFVSEQTDRVPFYSGLASLAAADGLIVPGSDDPGYTASKVYPYIMSRKPLLGVFHPESSAVKIIQECNAGGVITLNDDPEIAYGKFIFFLENVKTGSMPQINWAAFAPYTAKEMCRKQVELFDKAVS